MRWASKPRYDDPCDLVDTVKEQRAELVERIAELDDVLMMKYLDGETPTLEEMKWHCAKASLKTGSTRCFVVLH
jgi:translation elongation factor EF-G